MALLGAGLSCGDKNREINFQVLVANTWLESRTPENTAEQQTATTDYLYDFHDYGFVDIYAIEHGRAVLDKECRYIYSYDDEILAIETMGRMKVESISSDVMTLRNPEKNTTLRLTRYKGDIDIE